jgi:hypothetical protein
MTEGAQQIVKHHVDRYNLNVVHRSPPTLWRRQATPLSWIGPMNDL